MCQSCDVFDTRVGIHGPDRLRTVVGKICRALDAGILRCNDFESGRALEGQVRFSQLDLERTIPDVIRYYFECRSCGAVFGLVVESYHGQGGHWSRL